MRVVATSTPGSGHLGVLLPLLHALQAAGHDVTVVTASESCAMVEQAGFVARAGGMPVGDRLRHFGPRVPEMMALPPRRRRAIAFSGFFADAAAPVMLADLPAIIDDVQPEVIIHEMAELAAAPVAVSRSIPHLTVAFSGALPDDATGALLERIAPTWAAVGLDAPTLGDLVGGCYLHPFPPSFGQVPDVAAVQPMRAEPLVRSGDAAPEWLADLGRDRPLVYLTSGTEPQAAMAPWAAAVAALGSIDVDAVVTIGPHVDPEVLGPARSNVRVERFVPQAFILERAGLVMSHAGAGSLLGAARAGLPQLLNPLAADQWENADAASGAGVAITMEMHERSPEHIAAALDRLLNDDRCATAAKRVAGEIAAMPGAADVVPIVEALAAR